MSATPSWRYQETPGFSRYEGLPSPPFAASDPRSPILEYATFLQPVKDFSLDDDSESTSPNCQRGTTPALEQTGSSAPAEAFGPASAFKLCRTVSKDLERIVQSAYDEMDIVLSARRSTLSASAAIFHPSSSSMSLDESAHECQQPVYGAMAPSPHGKMDVEPSAEEQAWLDHHCDAMEHVAQIQAEAEAEESFVARMLRQHPELPVEEAYQLWEVCPSSPEACQSPMQDRFSSA